MFTRSGFAPHSRLRTPSVPLSMSFAVVDMSMPRDRIA